MHHYSNYDAWRTENPWDGQARMSGFADYADRLANDTDQEDDFDPDDLFNPNANY